MTGYPEFAQGPAKPATAEDIIKDNQGITNPNLHRRIDKDLSQYQGAFELLAAEGFELLTPENDIITATVDYGEGDPNVDFTLSVQAVNSYRTTSRVLHDEDSTTDEVP